MTELLVVTLLAVLCAWLAWLQSEERRRWAEERRELLNRIQHPHVVPGVPDPEPKQRRWDDRREAERARRDRGSNG